MTTIAIDAFGNIAADGRSTCGNEIARDDIDKLITAHNRIYALAGPGSLIVPLLAWHNDGADPTKLPVCNKEYGWTLIVLQADGLYTYSDKVPYGYANEYKTPVAFGSGQDYALGAMLAGKTAKEAVEIACKVDTGSGGRIKSLNIANTLALKLQDAAE